MAMSNETTNININLKSLIDKVIIINTSDTTSPAELAELIKQELMKVVDIANIAIENPNEP